MLFWIKKAAAVLGIAAFFLLLLFGMAGSRQFTFEALVPVFFRAVLGAGLFWVIGIVIADILVKGIITDASIDRQHLVEGGLLQRVLFVKEQDLRPGGAVKAAGKPGKKEDGKKIK